MIIRWALVEGGIRFCVKIQRLVVIMEKWLQKGSPTRILVIKCILKKA